MCFVSGRTRVKTPRAWQARQNTLSREKHERIQVSVCILHAASVLRARNLYPHTFLINHNKVLIAHRIINISASWLVADLGEKFVKTCNQSLF